MAVVYWAHLTTHTIRQGYIGVTTNFSKRRHHHIKKLDCLHLGRAITKYKELIVWDIVFEGTAEHCYSVENFLRPTENVGWNIRVGGRHSSGMQGKKHSEDAKQKMRKPKTAEAKQNISNGQKGHKSVHAKYCNIYQYKTDILLAEKVCLSDWAQENGYNRRCLSQTVTDKRRKQHKGIYIKYVKG